MPKTLGFIIFASFYITIVLINSVNPETIWKIKTKKKHKKPTLNGHISKTKMNSESKPTRQGGPSLQPPPPLPAERGAQKINVEPGKSLNLIFVVYFLWKWILVFKKNAMFDIWTKVMPLFNLLSPEMFWKFDIFK